MKSDIFYRKEKGNIFDRKTTLPKGGTYKVHITSSHYNFNCSLAFISNLIPTMCHHQLSTLAIWFLSTREISISDMLGSKIQI